MAITLATGDIVSFKAWSVLDEQAAVNTYNYLVQSVTGGGVTDADIVSDFDTLFMSPFYQALQPPSVEYRGTQVYFVKRSGFLPPPSVSLAGAHVGATGTDPMPRSACPLLRYTSFTRGPGGRGRVFLPFVATSFVADNGRPTNAFGVLVNSVASTLLVPITVTRGGSTATLVWGILKRHPKAVPGPIIEAISTAQAGLRIATLHKRGDYGRPNASPI